jgi:hypothetical protein
VIPFLHSWFVLELLPYRIQAGHEVVDTLPMKVLALQHLIAAAENQGTAVRVMGEWIDCRSLRHGAVMGAHFSKTTSELLNRYFSLARNQRISRALQWGKTGGSRDEGFYSSSSRGCLSHSFIGKKTPNLLLTAKSCTTSQPAIICPLTDWPRLLSS